MGLDKETTAALEDLENGFIKALEERDAASKKLRKDVDGLAGSFDELRTETAAKLADLADASPSSRTSSAPTEEETAAAAALHDEIAGLEDKVAQLQERNKYLEGGDYQNQIIEGFLKDLDRENFDAIGLKLGYLDFQDATPEDVLKMGGSIEVPLEDSQQTMTIQREQPEDMTGWSHVESQGVYIKIE